MKLFIFSFLAMVLGASGAQAADVYGLMSVVKGDVQIVSVKDKTTSKARVGQKVFPGDTVITGPESRAKVTMVDKNVINISPDSKLVVEKYEFKPEENKKNVTLNVVYGKVRSAVEQKYDGEQNQFHVKTPSAVAGVRGTDFLVSFNRGNAATKIVTFTGQVEVGAKIDGMGRIAEPVRVNPGQFTTSSPNSAPSQPAPMPASELNSLKRETAAETATGGNASNDAKPDPKKDAKSDKGDEKDKSGDKGESKDKSADKGKAEGSDKKEGGKPDQARSEGGDKKPPEGGSASSGEGNGKREPSSTGPSSGGSMSPGGSTSSGTAPMPVSMAPTIGDMTNTGPTFAGTAPRLPDPIGIAPIPPPIPIQQLPPTVNPDIIRSGNTKLIINIK